MKKFAGVLAVLVSVFALTPGMVFAQTTPDVSGSRKSSDFQASNNPQGNVGTGIQNTNNNLQPIPGKDNFSQPALSGTSDLRVEGVEGEANPNTTSIPNEAVKYPVSVVPYVVISILTLAGVLYVVLQPSDKQNTKETRKTTQEEEVKPEVVSISPKKVKKKTSKKKPSTKKHKK